MKNKRIIYGIIIVTGVVVTTVWMVLKPAPTDCVGDRVDSTTIIIGYQEIALYRHLFTAKAKGFFEEEGVNVELIPFASANQMIQAMIAGQLHATGLTNMQVALQIESKDPGLFEIVNLLVWQEDSYPDFILARKDANITALKDFEGKTMGLHPGSAVRAFSATVLQANGVDYNKVNFLELQPPMMHDAILAKRVDGLYCMDPIATILKENDQVQVIVANPMQYIFDAPIPISGTAISKKLIQDDPEAAQNITRALESAILYMREQDREEEIANYIAEYTPITSDLALKMNNSQYWTLEEIDRAQVQRLSDRFYELGIVEKKVNVNKIIVPAEFLSLSE